MSLVILDNNFLTLNFEQSDVKLWEITQVTAKYTHFLEIFKIVTLQLTAGDRSKLRY